jgi:hypothetical protein
MINIIPEKKFAHSKIRIQLRKKLRRINGESENVLQVGFMDPYFNPSRPSGKYMNHLL